MRQPKQNRASTVNQAINDGLKTAHSQTVVVQQPKVVAAYRFDSLTGKYEEYAVTVNGNLVGAWENAVVGNEIKIDQIDRIVFFKGNEQFLVIDLVPEKSSSTDIAKGSWIKWIPNSENGKVEVDGKIRCFLLNSSVTESDCLNFSARIRKIKGAEEFRFKVTTVEGRSSITFDNYSTDVEQAILKANAVLDTVSRENGFTRSIGLEIGGFLPNPKIRVFFRKQNFKHYIVRFESDLNARSKSLQTFDAEGEFDFPFTTVTLVQYPSKNIEPKDKFLQNIRQPVGRWVIQIQKIPAKSAVRYWNGYVEQYYNSLLTVQGGLPVSFLPKFKEPEDDPGKKSWAASYFIADASRRDNEDNVEYVPPDLSKSLPAKLDAITISALRIQQAEQQILKSQFGQLKKHDEQPLSSELSLDAAAEDSFENDDKGIVISFKKPVSIGSTSETTTVRMGALDLEFGNQDSPSNSTFRLLPYKKLFEVHADAVFAVAEIRAGGQDNIPGEDFVPEGSSTSDIEQCSIVLNDQELLMGIESVINTPGALKARLDEVSEIELEAHFRRKRPLVIDPQLALQTAAQQSGERKAKYLLVADEDAQKGSSHTIRLKLLSAPRDIQNPLPPEKPFSKEAIILDNEPFLVAKVKFNSFTQISNAIEIGNWTNAGVEGTNWQLRSETKPFQIVLPPQGVGEEMEKAKNVAENQALDFRFSPPAKLTLKGSENPQNFTEPPWNLRRILGFPGQRAPGAKIDQLQFELLYGLSCDSTYPFLRLAEISSLVGAIQGRLSKKARSADIEKLPDSDPKKLFYKLARLEWAALNRRYLSRVAILEPWDSHQPEHLLLSKNTVCRIRQNADANNELPAAELQPPVDVPPPTPTPTPSPTPTPTPTNCPVPLPTPPAATPPLLKGGVTWGFESKNVYNAVMRVKTGEINPTTDDAEINDLYFSAFGGWGSVKAPFDDKKSTIYADVAMGRTYKYKIERIGRIACWWNLAKHVIVYERTVVPSRQMNDLQNKLIGRPILRKTEEYVEILEDTRNYPDGDNPESDLLKQQRGFVKACSFSKGAKFNVLSSWGSDVGDIGWKVPLWNSSAAPADVYPKPKVYLHLISAIAERSVPAPNLIGNPENLYFYTETRAGSTRSPNGWLPVKNVDYVDLPKPQPLIDFQDGKNQQTTPNDAPTHPGFSVCTFTLEANGIPADIVAARVGKPLAAVVETVTMMRARLGDAANVANDLPERIINLRKSAADAFQDLLRQIPTDDGAAQNQVLKIRDEIKSRVGARFKQIGDDIAAFEADFNRRKQKIFGKLKTYETAIFDRIQKRLIEDRKGSDSIATAVKKQYDDIIANVINLEAAKRAARENLRALQEAILLLNASPGILTKTFRRYVEAYLSWAEESQTIALEFERSVDLNQPSDLSGETLRNFKTTVRELLQLAQALDARIKNGSFRPAEPWLPDPYEKLDSQYFSFVRDEWKTKEAKLKDALAATASLPKAAAKEIIDFFTGAWQANEKFSELRLFVAAFPDAAEMFGYLAEADLVELPGQKLKGWIGEQLNEIEKANTIDELRAVITNVLLPRVTGGAGVERSLLWQLKQIQDRMMTDSDAQELFDLAFGSVNDLIGKLKAQLGSLENTIGGITAEIRRNVEELRDEFIGKAEDFIEKNVLSLLPEDALKFASPDSVARLVRAFGRPPEVPNLGFDREQLAYYFKDLDQAVGLTPVLSRVKQASAVAEELKSIGIALPTERVLEKLIPPDLKNFSLSEILPNIAGLDLSNLFNGLKMPEMGNENIKVMHGFDPQSRRAWVESKIGVEIGEPATVFAIGPVTLRLTSALFAADVRFEAAPNEPPKRVVNGRIRGTWELIIGEIALVKFRDTELSFDDSGKFRFDISPLNVELPDILAFVSEFLKSFSNPDSGFSVGLTAKGVQALLNLPIPDIQAGAFGISNLVLGMAFGLDFSNDFKIYLSFSLGRKEAPFALIIFILGGGGYIEQVTEYTPATGAIACRVEVGITACASLAIALGPIKGGVFVYFGVFANLALSNNAADNKGLTIGVMLLIRGEVNVLGIAYACISLLLEARYRNGELIGRGKLSIKIKICWCFTLKVEKEIEYKLAGGGGSAQNRQLERFNEERAENLRDERAVFDNRRGNAPRFIKAGFSTETPPAPPEPDYAADYIEMLI